MSEISPLTLARLATLLDARLQGNGDTVITGLSTLQGAEEGQLSFLANAQYRKYLDATRASAVLLKEADAAGFKGGALIVPDPYLAYARLSHLFDPRPRREPGIHPSAVVADDAVVHPQAHVGPCVVIDSGAVIGAGVTIEAHCFIGARSQIGAGGWLAPRVTLYHDVVIGERVVIQSGAVLGSEGFGFANDKGIWQKIAQIGGVSIGDDVEIGANTTIDRGALGPTTLGNGVKLDNQIQIAHNVQVGDHTAMAACVGISGSTRIGRHCMIGGGVGIAGHLDICDHVFLTGMTMVTRGVSEPGAYSSGTVIQPAADWRKNAARFRQLDALFKRVQQLEKQPSAVTSDQQKPSED